MHVGTENCSNLMDPYMYKRNQEGIHIINLAKTWEKLMIAARIIAAVPNPSDVLVSLKYFFELCFSCMRSPWSPTELYRAQIFFYVLLPTLARGWAKMGPSIYIDFLTCAFPGFRSSPTESMLREPSSSLPPTPRPSTWEASGPRVLSPIRTPRSMFFFANFYIK